MDKSGVTQEISSMFFDSVPEMCIVLGDASNLTYQRISLDTVVEYLNESEWVEGVVSGCDTVTVGEESVTLAVNTTIRLKERPDIVGSLSLDKEFSSLEYSSKDLQVLNNLVYKSGVFKSMFFGEIQATGGMKITLTSSLAVIDGIVVFFETPQNVVLKAGYSTVRKDLIVIRKDQANGVSYLAVLEGVPDVNPRVPELTQNAFGVYEIPIAIITVQPNVVSISSRDIEDVRQLSLNLPELNQKIDDLKAEDIAYKGVGITGRAKNVKEALYAVSEAQLIIADEQEHFTGRYFVNSDGGRKPIYYRKWKKDFRNRDFVMDGSQVDDIISAYSIQYGANNIANDYQFSGFGANFNQTNLNYYCTLKRYPASTDISVLVVNFLAIRDPYIEYTKNTDSWEY